MEQARLEGVSAGPPAQGATPRAWGLDRVRRAAAGAIDGALEITVAGGFGSPGIATRRWIHHWEDLQEMTGRVVVLTGATSGIGRAAALALAGLGADLVLVGRDARRAEATEQEVDAVGGSGRVDVVLADLSLLDDAGRAADRILRDHPRIDALLHNAGALTQQFTRTREGFETTYSTQVLAPHVLTTALLPALAVTGRGRVVTVSSGGMYAERLDPDRVQMPADHYDGVRAYARAKRAQVVMTQEWARRFPGAVQFHSMHPGWADTPGVRSSLPRFRATVRPILRTPEQGADTLVWLAGVQPIPGPDGSFWLDRRPRGTVRIPGTGHGRREAARLWDRVCQDSGADPHGRGPGGPG